MPGVEGCLEPRDRYAPRAAHYVTARHGRAVDQELPAAVERELQEVGRAVRKVRVAAALLARADAGVVVATLNAVVLERDVDTGLVVQPPVVADGGDRSAVVPGSA